MQLGVGVCGGSEHRPTLMDPGAQVVRGNR
jgi:hypothetical protein